MPRTIATSRRLRKPANVTSHLRSIRPAIASSRKSSAQINVLPKHWWEGTDKSGNKRDINATSLEPPLGNGAYKIKEFTPGRNIVYDRVKDYWGKDLNVNVGRDNFDELRFEYFRDTTVALEAFKADVIDWRVENSAKDWATAYVFPAVKEKRVILEEFPIRSLGVMQGYAFNLRRDKFKDPRVREAFNYALDFEDMNKAMFFGQYKRIASYFEGTELASSGLPQGRELEILETVRDKIPPEVFTKPYPNPVGGSPENVRAQFARGSPAVARSGLRSTQSEAGQCQDRRTVKRRNSRVFSRVSSGSRCATCRTSSVLASMRAFAPSMTHNMKTACGNGISTLSLQAGANRFHRATNSAAIWGSQAADQPGSRNVGGIKNHAVDALIDQIIFAKNRDDLVAATRALDRVLLWNFYVVPQWTYGKVRTARWDRFWQAGKTAGIRRLGIPDDLVVGHRKGCQDRVAPVTLTRRHALHCNRWFIGRRV